MSFYTVKLLDSDGCEMASHEHNNLREAKAAARAAIAEKEYLDAGAHKVEVLDEQGVNVWDRFRPHCKVCGEPMPDSGECCGTDEFPEPGDIREAS